MIAPHFSYYRVRPGQDRAPRPRWAGGLAQLYGRVANDPLPDDLAALAERLVRTAER